jgi:hypothetical protein
MRLVHFPAHLSAENSSLQYGHSLPSSLSCALRSDLSESVTSMFCFPVGPLAASRFSLRGLVLLYFKFLFFVARFLLFQGKSSPLLPSICFSEENLSARLNLTVLKWPAFCRCHFEHFYGHLERESNTSFDEISSVFGTV